MSSPAATASKESSTSATQSQAALLLKKQLKRTRFAAFVFLCCLLELDVQITCSFSQIILIHEDFFFGFFLELNKNPIEGFSAGLVNDDNIYEWQFCIIGAPDTL